MFISRDHSLGVTLHSYFEDTVIRRIYFDSLDGAPGENNPLRGMKPSEDLRKILVLGYDAKLRIGEDPGQLFEKLRAGKKKELTCSASAEDTGRRSFPSYRRDQDVGI